MVYSAILDLICSIGFISASWPSGLWFLYSLYIFSFAQKWQKFRFRKKKCILVLEKGVKEDELTNVTTQVMHFIFLIPLFLLCCAVKR